MTKQHDVKVQSNEQISQNTLVSDDIAHIREQIKLSLAFVSNINQHEVCLFSSFFVFINV